MPGFNKVMIIGNLTRDPQVKTVGGGTTVAEFGMAVNRRFKTQAGEDKEEVTFVDCTAFGKQADTIGQWCKKGKPLFIEGRLKLDQWDDKQSGAKRSKLTVIVEGFQFLGSRDDGGGGSGGRSNEGPDWAPDERGQSAPARQPQRQQAPPQRQQQPRSRQPASGGGGGGRPQAAAPAAEPPFGDEQQFNEADIPFAWEGRRSSQAI